VFPSRLDPNLSFGEKPSNSRNLGGAHCFLSQVESPLPMRAKLLPQQWQFASRQILRLAIVKD
jgi:hypothetical protein